ncbi:M56 family metallopeptidase [Qipengyuania sp. Mu-71]|jgi:beta-lactamase regulating signal transducer with metallopeptidase domain|uniref:M56 family metallopeptidase n=1 Tax=Qipengyuania sp. Mu-71 TaxID=3121477 RepID=UPI002FE4DCB0
MTELIREYWSLFLLDTLVWTGVLIGVALLLRRPVAKYLGAGAAYALWFLPLIRMLFPPVTLPAWMRPDLSGGGDAGSEVIAADLAFAPSAESGFSYSEFVSPAGTAPLDTPIDLLTPLVIVWLVGAAIFMGRRFWLYGELRRELLEDARPVGEVGPIRLIETTAISGPMAFGVFDKVVALPDGFMASRERQVRDLAIAHELAHHRGHDILVNVLVQPLFAIHWFNPLGWMGWSAMRRDQEAACDARVVASRSREERAAYAAIIADFARRPQIAPRPALAAPMACPVLGDKSIIHRLRSLPMTDHSRRRRFAVRGAVAAAVFALPMTASIGYAEGIAAHVPGEPFALQTPVAPLSPLTPEAPDAPQAPEPPSDREFVAAMERTIEREFDRAERDIERAERELERARESMARVERDPARHARWDGRNWDQMSDKEKRAFKKEMAQLREDLADGGKVQRELQQIEARQVDRAESRREVQLALAEAHAEVAQVRAEAVAEKAIASAPKVVMKCLDKDRAVTTKVDAKGRTTMYVCESYGDTVALKALKHTRESLAADRNWSDEMRAEILADIDAEIERLSR